jgi:hypothetical protein
MKLKTSLLIVLMSLALGAVFPVGALAVGTLEGSVTDGDPAAAIPDLQGVEVEVMSRDETVSYTSVFTDANGQFSATGIPAGDIRAYFRLAGYVETFGDYSIRNDQIERTNVWMAPVSVLDGDIDGNIIDATDNTINVDGVQLTLYAGVNQSAGAAAATAVTAADGTFSFPGVAPGTYTLHAHDRVDYNDDMFQVVSIGGSLMTYPDLTLSPMLAAGEIRIVMSWGERPTDLDSHLYTPAIGGTEYHIYYPASNRGSLTSNPYAYLDVDDVTSYGPETVTIAQSFDGEYNYVVHNYAGEVYGESTSISDSGCVVKVYDDTGLIATYSAPPSYRLTDEYNWWVFSYDGATGRITSRDASPEDGSDPVDIADLSGGGPDRPDSNPCFIRTAAGGPAVDWFDWF